MKAEVVVVALFRVLVEKAEARLSGEYDPLALCFKSPHQSSQSTIQREQTHSGVVFCREQHYPPPPPKKKQRNTLDPRVATSSQESKGLTTSSPSLCHLQDDCTFPPVTKDYLQKL